MIVHVDFLKRSLSVHVGLQQTKDVDVYMQCIGSCCSTNLILDLSIIFHSTDCTVDKTVKPIPHDSLITRFGAHFHCHVIAETITLNKYSVYTLC